MKKKKIYKYMTLFIAGLTSVYLYASSAGVDTKDLEKGIVHISYKSSSGNRLKVMIEKDGQKYTYNLDSQGKTETYPLQLGNGQYKISILENTTGSKYKLVHTEEVTLAMKNPNDVYLNSIQSIEWSDTSGAIQKGNVLTKSIMNDEGKVSTLYDYITKDYSYDYNKLETLPTTYLPVIDETFKVQSGICYDFSALYAAMLRSQGIPVKLVKGYTPNAKGYHAWNEAYDVKTGTWSIIDTTYDLQMVKKNRVVNMKKKAEDYEKTGEY
ncbi:transglutaminase-like domain-containing protein [Zhenhengia yiwuensis]|uniref:transglutaminase-like domain-containing protein n=1 Tax=Zhenhengia yiwuensis TaxID=2763666 RepID=UPI002A751759|nr:transglutaminase-like domain-containing protein [Zhenhengia yiwuensis]MDY3368225.1 transglutaminase-like domain-containing protein [Zhenhengia yiwuensis]